MVLRPAYGTTAIVRSWTFSAQWRIVGVALPKVRYASGAARAACWRKEVLLMVGRRATDRDGVGHKAFSDSYIPTAASMLMYAVLVSVSSFRLQLIAALLTPAQPLDG